jgi:ABC-type lipoprotein release transport system permease subunit
LTFTRRDRDLTVRVVGVVSNVANTDRTAAPPPRIWVPIDAATRRRTYVVKADAPAALASEVRALVAAHAPAVPIEDLQTLDAALEQAASSDYVVIGTLSGFAVLALLLATTGLFGVVSYAVAQRTAEFGTRMALGATAADVVRLVARQSVGVLIAGLAIGLAGGVGIGFAMHGALNGLSPMDPLTIGSVAGLLAMVTLVATVVPAWRAARIDPAKAINK